MPAGLPPALMPTRVLLLADIHGNYPALQAIAQELDTTSFDYIVNCGDSVVYAPFPSETLHWLTRQKAVSILGNTDKKVLDILQGRSFKKPKKPEKRIMYTSTAEALDPPGRQALLAFPEWHSLDLPVPAPHTAKRQLRLGIFHGSPADPDEFLFADTPDERFVELAEDSDCDIIVTGHSHSPYHKVISQVHFINPGSAGRMFDGDPRVSCAVLEIGPAQVSVRHLRIAYNTARVVAAIGEQRLPAIYALMFLQGRKLN